MLNLDVTWPWRTPSHGCTDRMFRTPKPHTQKFTPRFKSEQYQTLILAFAIALYWFLNMVTQCHQGCPTKNTWLLPTFCIIKTWAPGIKRSNLVFQQFHTAFNNAWNTEYEEWWRHFSTGDDSGMNWRGIWMHRYVKWHRQFNHGIWFGAGDFYKVLIIGVFVGLFPLDIKAF